MNFAALLLAIVPLTLASAPPAPPAPPGGTFPLSSWVTYAVARGPGTPLLQLNASFVVPQTPRAQFGAASPGFWLGAMPDNRSAPLDRVARPVLAWGSFRPQFTVFGEGVDLFSQDYWQSSAVHVLSGQQLQASLLYDTNTSCYGVTISSNGAVLISNVISLNRTAAPLTDIYVVMENAPKTCAELPSPAAMAFTGISGLWQDHSAYSWNWTLHQGTPACSAEVKAPATDAVTFTWSTSQAAGSSLRRGNAGDEL